ncbi:MAG: hypothetical protein JST44_06480 [Cyanobacteria bacterium SZAS LIN-5]|nr:hypothetical protein [Cyanobacteria bacterium SZAS LIN-5]
MLQTAVVWIRDGVLIDRMPINAAAFGCASWLYAPVEARKPGTLEHLINFAFEKSGFSCAAKMMMYNAQRENIISDVEAASGLYNVLAAAAGNLAEYFSGTIELLDNLTAGGVRNFVSSAVEQSVLDEWLTGPQGSQIASLLTEAMGKRQRFAKGKDHFKHVSELGCNRIFYVADALSEVRTASSHSHEFNIYPIGFANEISTSRVLDAIAIVRNELAKLEDAKRPPFADELLQLEIDASKLVCPDPELNRQSLAAEGAVEVIEGDRDNLMPNLRMYFDKVL